VLLTRSSSAPLASSVPALLVMLAAPLIVL